MYGCSSNTSEQKNIIIVMVAGLVNIMNYGNLGACDSPIPQSCWAFAKDWKNAYGIACPLFLLGWLGHGIYKASLLCADFFFFHTHSPAFVALKSQQSRSMWCAEKRAENQTLLP